LRIDKQIMCAKFCENQSKTVQVAIL